MGRQILQAGKFLQQMSTPTFRMSVVGFEIVTIVTEFWVTSVCMSLVLTANGYHVQARQSSGAIEPGFHRNNAYQEYLAP